MKYIVAPLIVFAHKPSVALLSVEDMQLTRIPEIDKEHPIFQQLSSVDGFDYAYINNILVIPDPVPTAKVNWDKNIVINNLTVECPGNFIVFFHFELSEDVIFANFLTLTEYVFLQNRLQYV